MILSSLATCETSEQDLSLSLVQTPDAHDQHRASAPPATTMSHHLSTLTTHLRTIAPLLEPPMEDADVAWSDDLPALRELLRALAGILDGADAEAFVLDKEERDLCVVVGALRPLRPSS